MKAIIQAGGVGSRLRPITHEIPKPLIPVKKKPILNHIIKFLKKYGVTDIGVVINKNHKEDFDQWLSYWRKYLPVDDISIFIEEKPSGTFGWLRRLKSWIGREDFILSNGDTLVHFDLDKLKEFHKTNRPLATIALIPVPDPRDYGAALLEGNYIRGFSEKQEHPHTNLVSAGLYILHPDIFEYDDVSKDFVMTEKDIFPQLAKVNKLMGLQMEDGQFFDCGTLERWEQAMREWPEM